MNSKATVNGINLWDAYVLAIEAAGARGQIKPGVFERQSCLIWTPPVAAGVA